MGETHDLRHNRHAATIGDAVIDRVLRGFIDSCDATFPGRVRAYYLTGSWADGTAARTPGDALNSSDVDVTVVFAGSLSDAEAGAFRHLRAACERLSGLGLDQLDATAVGEDVLLREGHLALKVGSRLLRGADVRAAIPVPVPAAHIARAVRISTDVMATIRGLRTGDLLGDATPGARLAYPDPSGEFYGYDFRDATYGGVPGTRILLDGLSWGATASLAIGSGALAATKREAIRQYAAWVGGERGAMLQELYDWCKLRWRYQIPRDADDRLRLRRLCARVLPFETHLLRLYRGYRSADPQGVP